MRAVNQNLNPGAADPRRFPIGAEVLPDGSVHFRIWASMRKKVRLLLEDAKGGIAGELELKPEAPGYFAVSAPQAAAGTRYRFLLDEDALRYPDPASRFQPDGPHGPSQVVDPNAFRWTDSQWRGLPLKGQVFYELHIGTFTPEGTWRAAQERLAALKEVGVTAVEVMPVSDFPGRFGWGYDGVNLFAPTRLYGEPDDFRRFVDRAHALGMGVLLDVVYNHIGPDGNYLKAFSADYFTAKYRNEWGEALNFDGPGSGPVREFFISNAAYWIDEFHLDGLRLDATQQIYDASENHLLAEIGRAAKGAGGGRQVLLIAENESQHSRLVRPEREGGYGLDGIWNDDFHHSAIVRMTGRKDAYYLDYRGAPQEFVSSAKAGYLYQGQYYSWQKKKRGSPGAGILPEAFVHYLENHDQVSNLGRGLRIHQMTDPGTYRAITALLLLLPQTPMLFQGQEFAASAPFVFFADHNKELARLVDKGRREFLAQFRHLASPAMNPLLDAPAEESTFRKCKLDFGERALHREAYALHRDLLALRREDPVFSLQGEGGLDGAVLTPEAFCLRYFSDGGERLVVVNFGPDEPLCPAPEPLLAAPPGHAWEVLWSSEHPDYGGSGTPPFETSGGFWIQGRSAVVLRPSPTSGEGAPEP